MATKNTNKKHTPRTHLAQELLFLFLSLSGLLAVNAVGLAQRIPASTIWHGPSSGRRLGAFVAAVVDVVVAVVAVAVVAVAVVAAVVVVVVGAAAAAAFPFPSNGLLLQHSLPLYDVLL